ncbi:VCBS repeat-containing protein [Yoonia sp. 208BN28-4]|uniref:VCBS repeat-containing protein n=1 Tax=Yoonia sp. 208BN28-4 TaxID=3126505 RepID=UPI00309B5B1D
MRLAGLLLAVGLAGPATAEVLGARYESPTDVYGHGAVDGGEYAALTFRLSDGRELSAGTFRTVYEDTAPRLVDLDLDGSPEVVTVVSYFDAGAAIRIWDEIPSADHPEGTTMAVVAETAPIGTRHRWLAIAGAADLDGDGRIEIAYVDRPHLAKVLRIVEVRAAADGWSLVEEAAATGFTNHKYRDPNIEGGVRLCNTPEIITASADWTRVQASRLVNGAIVTRDVGPYTGPQSMTEQLDCS